MCVCVVFLAFPLCAVRNAVLVAKSSILGFSLAATVGQNFIYFTINNFNPLVCTTITTTRKFFTILFSVLVYGHNINAKQWG